MRPFHREEGVLVPLDRSDVDTDQIIPKQFLKRIERTGYGEYLFNDWRRDANGAIKEDFVLNQDAYAGGTVMVAGRNFGCGSSREHAVWALTDYGFQAVISPRFGDIFRNNSTKAGLVPVQVSPEVGRALLDAVTTDPSLEITVDIERLRIEAPAAGIEADFPLDAFTQHRLLEGLDDIGLSLRFDGEIDAYEAGRPAWLPSLTGAV
jgi:3-isopropylmalate/(R)-2-methylmalate dehydratase small subunit